MMPKLSLLIMMLASIKPITKPDALIGDLPTFLKDPIINQEKLSRLCPDLSALQGALCSSKRSPMVILQNMGCPCGMNHGWDQGYEKKIDLAFALWKKKTRLSGEKAAFVEKIFKFVCRENQALWQIRQKIFPLFQAQRRGQRLSQADQRYLKKLFEQYQTSNIRGLLSKIDVIPPSLAIAQSIEESGWGRCGNARKKNSCFGMLCGNGCLIKYDSLQGCVISYMQNLNRHRAYLKMRELRQKLRHKNQKILGTALLPGIRSYCVFSNYTKKIGYIISKYQLEFLDRSTLP